jgi:hypothetical protein
LVVVAIVDIVDTELVDLVLIDLVLIVSSFCLETFPDFSGPFLDFSEFLNLQFFVVASFHFFINLVYTHFLLLQVSGFMLALMPIPYCNFSVLDGFLASFNTFAYSSLVSGRQIRRYTSRDDAIFAIHIPGKF